VDGDTGEFEYQGSRVHNMTMSVLEDKLIAAGLPVYVADESRAVFSRSLSDDETALYLSIICPPDYAELRRREYPPLEDLADAIYWMERKDKSLMEAWLKNCDAVKAKYPKTTPAR